MICSTQYVQTGVGLCLLILTGCQITTPRQAGPIYRWPPPPASPRITFVQEVGGPSDFGIHPSLWQKSANWLTGGQRGREPWSCPFGVWIDTATNVCFTDTARREVVYIESGRKQIERWNRIGDQALDTPVGVACASGVVYVADSGLGCVLMADTKGRARGRLPYAFKRPVAVAVTPYHVYVVDAVACCVQVFSPAGVWERTLGEPGDGPGQLNRPTHVAVDPAGTVYVTDSLNARIQIFDERGEPVRSLGKPGDSSGHFGRPKGVAVDEQGHVFVVDGLFSIIQIFDQQGRLSMDFGGTGHEPGEFWLPAGIAVQASGMLIVADSYNQRLQIFQLERTVPGVLRE